MMVRETWPDLPVHLSVQSNVVNYATVRFWQSLGIERIILSRELSLEEIEEIKQRCPEMELEVFVHGALCIAYSGRCLLSGYFNHRDANQGTCTNSCRWEYNVHDAQTDISGDVQIIKPHASQTGSGSRHIQSEKVYLLEEKNRPGELMPVEEDENGTYIMNSRDLRAVQHIEKLIKIGVDSLKIEGRTKSYYYTARSAQVYRQAIDDAVNGKPFNPELMLLLDNLANRGYTDGFFQRHNSDEYQNYLDTRSSSARQKFVGELISYDTATGLADVDVKNKFAIGDRLELISPTGNTTFVLEHMEDLKGNSMDIVPGGGYQVRIALNHTGHEFGLLARYN
jgi:putative protease